MRIGLYGLPCAGKSYLLDRIDFMPVCAGSRLLREQNPAFDRQTPLQREQARKHLARRLMACPDFIMDGHYAFGDEIVFTEEDGQLYDVFLYLYLSPEVLKNRMASSEKNKHYLDFDLPAWQDAELQALRRYCHDHEKDFYVLDCPPDDVWTDITDILNFIRAIRDGYSGLSFARQCVAAILNTAAGSVITLTDGDRTLTQEDSSRAVLNYRTNLFDGNFYTGYQVWQQSREFSALPDPDLSSVSIQMNRRILDRLGPDCYILTSGHEQIWRFLAAQLGLPCFCGPAMSADTKFFITALLQKAGKQVIAYGDSLNDYDMLRQADLGYLVQRPDGTVSSSLEGRDLEGFILV